MQGLNQNNRYPHGTNIARFDDDEVGGAIFIEPPVQTEDEQRERFHPSSDPDDLDAMLETVRQRTERRRTSTMAGQVNVPAYTPESRIGYFLGFGVAGIMLLPSLLLAWYWW